MLTGLRDLPLKWDYETEIVVVGYGGAGAAAAIEAHDNGAAVCILEKASVAGGSTAMSGGIIVGAGTSVQRARNILGLLVEDSMIPIWSRFSVKIQLPTLSGS